MFTIHAKEKKKHGKSISRRLRMMNKLPAIIYGNNDTPIAIELNHDNIMIYQQNEKFYTENQTLIIDGTKIIVKVHAIQRHPYKPKLYHIDFIRI